MTRTLLISAELLSCTIVVIGVLASTLLLGCAAWDWPRHVMMLMVLPLVVTLVICSSVATLLFGVINSPIHRWTIGIGFFGVAAGMLAIFVGLSLEP